MNRMKRQNDGTLKDELPRLVGAQYATGDWWMNIPRKNEEMEPKQKQLPVVDLTGDESKVQYYEERYCIGTWNVRSMNQGKLDVVKPVNSPKNGQDDQCYVYVYFPYNKKSVIKFFKRE